MKIYFKPEYSNIFNGLKTISSIKNRIIMSLLDGNWHYDHELIKTIKNQHQYLGSVTLQTMIESLNHKIENNYLEKKIESGKVFYKLSDNYLGLTRAAYTKFRFSDV